MKRNCLKFTAYMVAGTIFLASGSMGLDAAPTAGMTSYTSNIVTSTTLPTAGASLAVTESILNQTEDQLVDTLARSVNIILNRFPVIDNIIFVSDSGSWRKQLPIPPTLKDVTYKGNREGFFSEVDWDYIWRGLQRFLDRCSEEGMTVSRYNNIEGDDWVWYWSRRLNSEGINAIIWSSDCDLKQLIQQIIYI